MSDGITGGCNCGAVRFAVTRPFRSSVYCHCRRCQRRTGTGASANARVDEADFQILAGADRVRSWKPETGAEKFFCGDCGSALYSRSPGSVGVRLGALDADPGIRPTARQFVTYAAPWEPIPDDGLPRFAESQSAGR